MVPHRRRAGPLGGLSVLVEHPSGEHVAVADAGNQAEWGGGNHLRRMHCFFSDGEMMYLPPRGPVCTPAPRWPRLGISAKHGRLYRSIKRQITARVDADVLDWLKSYGKGYQARLNAILRREMLASAK